MVSDWETIYLLDAWNVKSECSVSITFNVWQHCTVHLSKENIFELLSTELGTTISQFISCCLVSFQIKWCLTLIEIWPSGQRRLAVDKKYGNIDKNNENIDKNYKYIDKNNEDIDKNSHFVTRNEWWVWNVDLWFELEAIFTCTSSDSRDCSFLQLSIHANLVFTFISGYWTLNGRLCGQEDKYQTLYHQVGFWVVKKKNWSKHWSAVEGFLLFTASTLTMNRTCEFRQVLSDCTNLSIPSDPRIKSGKYSSLLVKKPKSLKTEWINFDVGLRRLVKTISQMRVFLIQNRKDYINI